jgi:hypothetical protein
VQNHNIFGAWTRHGQTRTHKTHHGLNLGEANTFPPYSILCAWPQDHHPIVILSRDSQVGVSKFPKLGLLQLWRPITLCANLRLRWGLKQSCSLCQDISNNMWHATYTQGRQGDSVFLTIRSQIVNLTPGLFFGHNLCFNHPNGSWEPILNI